MIPYAKIAALLAAMALGAAIAVWGYATPRIDALKAQMAANEAKNSEATAAFLKDSQARQKEIQDAADKAAADYEAQRQSTDRMLVAARADNVSLRRNIASYTSSLAFKLPATSQTLSAANGSAIAGWKLLETCLDVANTSSGQAEQLAGQVRGLQEFIGK